MSEEEPIYITCNTYEEELKERNYGEKIYDIDGNKIVTLDTLYNFIDDLLSDLDNLNDEYEYFKEYVEQNYKFVPISNQVEISDRDFI